MTAGLRARLSLARIRLLAKRFQGLPGRARCGAHTVRFIDGVNFYMSYKDIFLNRIYHFESVRPDPVILDCGGNIGVSLLYFKSIYPAARVTAFEADPAIFPFLEENVRVNGLRDVRLVNAALSSKEGSLRFFSDGRCGSFIPEDGQAHPPRGWTAVLVPSVRLREYLAEPVDFLKMNIEGAEWDVLQDSEDRLRAVREIAIEYHHLPGLPRTLHRILDLLSRCGFEYLVHHFDYETNPEIRPPFRLHPDSRYFLLVYAKRTA